MKILLIEDNAADAQLVAEMLRQVPLDPLELVREDKISKALARLQAEHYDVILLDLPMPAGRALNDVERICSAAARSAVVVLSGQDDDAVAVNVMRRGAQDCLHKGTMSPSQISRVLRYAVERKRAAEAQTEQMARYRSLTHAISDAIISANRSGAIIFWNIAAEKIFGYPEAEIMGKSLRLLIPERYHVSLQAELRRCETLKAIPAAARYLALHACRRDGAEFPVELSIGKWWHGDEMCFTGIIRDITERNMAEAAVIQSRDELGALSRRLLAVQEEERSRISLKVHDDWASR
jgi:PAS domain S-box-containing protein